jgi:hypothetical protein
MENFCTERESLNSNFPILMLHHILQICNILHHTPHEWNSMQQKYEQKIQGWNLRQEHNLIWEKKTVDTEAFEKFSIHLRWKHVSDLPGTWINIWCKIFCI